MARISKIVEVSDAWVEACADSLNYGMILNDLNGTVQFRIQTAEPASSDKGGVMRGGKGISSGTWGQGKVWLKGDEITKEVFVTTW